MKKVYVIGHRNPDTDSICSAIAYANLKNQVEGNGYEAYRAGNINGETRYVLDTFGIKDPKYVSDVRPRLKDVNLNLVKGAKATDSLKSAREMMQTEKIVSLPVLDGKKMIGLVSISDVLKADMDVYDNEILAKAKTPYKNVVETLDGTLQAGDILTVRIQEETSSPNIPAVNLPIDIVYEDEDIIVINKAAGMPIHPSLNNYRNSLANALMWYYEQQNKPFIFRCTNRLDRDTSGLTVVAKHMVSSNILSSMTARHQIEREYLAIVRGHVTPFEGTINAPIGRTGSSLIERKIDFENGEHAITHYHTVFEKNGLSLVSLILETGRTHQIRVHMKHLGFPLIGDYLYNPDMELIDRQALHSHCLRFLHPITGRQMTFTADLPEDMARLFA